MKKDMTPSRTARLGKRALIRALRNQVEVICMTPRAYADALSTAIGLMEHGEEITCRIQKGWELVNGLADELNKVGKA